MSKFIEYMLVTLLAIISTAGVGLTLCPIVESHFTKLSPGELIDKAWAIPGAILITPHRDLIEMGLVEVVTAHPEAFDKCKPMAHVISPTIAVPTKNGWCLWQLGLKGGHVNSRGACAKIYLDFSDITSVTSENGYQAAFDQFQKCIESK